MLNKIISAIMAMLMFVSTISIANAEEHLVDVEDLNNRDAVELLYNLGIVQGNENGEFLAENPVSRIEFAIMILRMMGLENISAGPHNFNDIPSTHWAYNQVSALNELDICDGIADDYFGATETVTFDQAAKMMVSALGYKEIAEQDGGYPEGYLSMALQLGILKDVSIEGTNLKRIEAACLINNCLGIKMGPGRAPQYADRTMLDVLGVEVYEGTVTGIYSAQENGALSPGEVEIDNVHYILSSDCIFREDELFGQKVKYYIKEPTDNKEICYMLQLGDIKTLTVDAENITKVASGEFEYKKGINRRTENTATFDLMTVYYNGLKVTSNYVNASILKPDEGKVVLYDMDDNNIYETALVTSYETLSVMRIEDGKIYDEYGYHFDMSNCDNIRVYKDGTEVAFSEITAGDVIAIARDVSSSNVDIFISRDYYMDGTVKSYKTDNDGNHIYTIVTSDGEQAEYRVASNYKKAINEGAFNAKNFNVGDTLRFYMNINSRIVKVKSIPQEGDDTDEVSTASRRKNSMLYGFIWSVVYESIDDVIAIEVLTEDNKFETYSTNGKKITFGRNSGGSYQTSKASGGEIYAALTASGTKQIVTYELDEDGSLLKLCIADTKANDDYLCLSRGRAETAYSNKMFASTYYVDQDTVVFSVPGTWSRKGYSSAGAYNKYFSSGNYHVIMYDVSNDGHIGAIVYPSQSVTTYSNSTGGSEVYIDPTNSTVMLVDSVMVGIVDDEEKTIIKGYENGLYKERVLADTLNSGSDSRSLISEGSIIQYETNSIERGRAEKSENPEEIILFRHILNLNNDNPKNTTWGYHDSLITRVGGTTTLNDSGLVISVAEIEGITDRAIKIHSDRDLILLKHEGTSIFAYNRGTNTFTPKTLDDLQTGMDIVVRQRNNNVIEIIYYE